MKIVEATWEKRNLGVSALEITIEKDDNPQECISIINARNEEYQVIKIPTECFEMSRKIQEFGFRFIELLTSCAHNIELPELSKLQTRLCDSICCIPITADSKLVLLDAINGSLFQTDRVSIDPSFTSGQAAARYQGWITDEIDSGGEIMELQFNGEFGGFFLIRDLGEGEFICNLAGLMPRYLGSGMGYFLNYFQIQEVSKRRGKTLISTYSSNNRGASALHLSIGYTLREQLNVFVKHNRPNSDR